MIHSMTGFGRAEINEDGIDLSAELRSVNHRFLDTAVRFPRSLSELETRAREQIGRTLTRGRITGVIQWGSGTDDPGEIVLNREVADRYYSLLCTLKETYNLTGELEVSTMAGRQDIWKVEGRELDLEAVWMVLEKCLAAALKDLVGMRKREGGEIAKDLSERVGTIGTMSAEIEKWMPEKILKTKDRLEERLNRLISKPEIPPERLAVEAAVLADRMDCTEECVRLRIHCDQFEKYLADGGPVGRKLNFLLQEMGREANTIGVKANDAEVSLQVVRLKEEVEKLREQVQNVE